MNSWDCVSHDVSKNLDLNNKKPYIKCNVIVSVGFNKIKSIQMYKKSFINNVLSRFQMKV